MTPRIITEAEVEKACLAAWDQHRQDYPEVASWDGDNHFMPLRRRQTRRIIRAAIKSLGLKLESKKGTRK